MITITPYSPADYEEVWALHQKTIQENDGFVKNLPFHSDFQNIQSVYESFFVMRKNDDLVGMVGLKSDGEIKRLQVASQYKGQGYGRKLMDHVLAHAKRIGMTRVHLDVSAPNKEARQLYNDMGFIIIRTQPSVNYGPDQEAFDMTFMEKIL